MPSDLYYKRTSRWLLVIFLVTAVSITAAGYYAYSQMREEAELGVRTQLLNAVDMKLAELQVWTDERYADASMVAADVPLLNAIHAVIQAKASPARKLEVTQWVEGLCRKGQYANAFLFDPDAKVVLQFGSPFGDSSHFRELVDQSMGANLAVLRELHVDSTSSVLHLGLNIPLRVSAESRPFGVLSLGIDPEQYVLSMLDRPLVPVGGGATILVRREGDEALLLFRHEAEGSRRQLLHVPLSRSQVVAVQAIQGKRGLVQGLDPDGHPIIAAVRTTPWAQWLLVSRVPLERIEAPIRRRAIPIVIAVALLIAAAGLGVTLLWRLQRVRFLEARHKSELEKAVLASHYSYLSRSSLDSILLLDEQGIILETNDRALEMYGRSREELLGVQVSVLHTPELQAEFAEQWQRILSAPSALFETRHQRKDGTAFPVEINVRPIAVDGKMYYQAIVRDITQRDLARRQLENANRLYAVLSGSNQAIATAATEHELFDSVCQIGVETGGFKFVIIGMQDEKGTTLVPVANAGTLDYSAHPIPLDLDPVRPNENPIVEAFHTGKVCVLDDIAVDRRRTPWHEQAYKFGLRSAACVPLRRHGNGVGVLAIFKDEPHLFDAQEVALVEEMGADISYALERLAEERRREQVEEALRNSEKRYRRLVESLPVGIMVHRDLRILYMSPAGLRMLRANSLKDVVGRPALSFVHPDYHEIVRQRAALGSGVATPTIEERYLRLDGTTFDVEVSAVPVEMDGQEARLVFFLDITQRRKAEDERARMEQQFLQAQKMESVGRLAGGVAHDFNNHLTVINGYCEMLISALPEDDPMRTEVLSIQKAGQQAAELVRQLLAFSRKRIAEPKHVNLNHQVMDSRRMLERLIGEHIQFETVLAPGVGDVLADPTQIQQILMNLVVNARDAMSSGGRLTIETRQVRIDARHAARYVGARPGDFVCLSVSDTGAGMDAETLRHLFEPFFTTKPHAVGTGLGLSTVYGIVRQSNGWIEVESAPGAGATFRIFLPRVAGGAGPDGEAASAGRAVGGRETVLLVEDQPQVRELSANILKGLGYSVLEAAGGAEALAIAGAHSGEIDILVSDVVMPGMTGPQLAKEMRVLRPSVKVLYVSGYVTDAELVNVVSGENVHHLSKPFTPAALASKVRETLAS